MAKFGLSELQAAGDPRHAPAAADRPRAREDRRRVQGAAGADRAAARDPRLRRRWCSRSIRRGARARSSERFGDERRTEIIPEDAASISIEDLIADEDMVDHRLARRLHQALAALDSTARSGAAASGSAAWRRKEETSSSTCSSPRRTATCWSSPDPAGSTGSRCTRSRRRARRRAARRSSTCCRPPRRREGGGAGRGADFAEEHFLVFATEQRHGQEDRARRVREHPRDRHHRDQHSTRATTCSTSASPTAPSHIFLGTPDGMAIRFAETDARPMGRDTAGVRGISLREDDSSR